VPLFGLDFAPPTNFTFERELLVCWRYGESSFDFSTRLGMPNRPSGSSGSELAEACGRGGGGNKCGVWIDSSSSWNDSAARHWLASNACGGCCCCANRSTSESKVGCAE
jgi:hypothetical protein